MGRERIEMVRNVTLALGMFALTAASSGAMAQFVGPVPGSGNATQSAGANRDQQAAYNRIIGNIDPVKVVPRGIKGKPKPAVAADLKPGSPLRDIVGAPIGPVAAVEADGVIVDTGKTKIKVPIVAFGKDDLGLLLGINAAKFGELIAKAQAGS
jgi:hypothetical protein